MLLKPYDIGTLAERRLRLLAFAFGVEDAARRSPTGSAPSGLRPRDVAIIGDNFMLPEKFEQAIKDVCGDAVAIRTMRLPFPDKPMEYDSAWPGMAGSRSIKVIRMKSWGSWTKPKYL
jgi:hypothetical protein